MDALTDKPEDIGLDSKPQAERDRIDLNHEISGESTGRMQRFFAGDWRDLYGENEKKKAERHFQNMLDLLLAEDPHYAALYYKVAENLQNAQRAADLALVDNLQHLAISDRKLRELRDKAAELPDGTKVFKSQIDGGIYTEDGKRLSESESANIRIPEHASSWEAYSAEKAENDNLKNGKADIETYQHDVLDHAKKRMDDKNDPPSMDELKELNEKIKSKMPDIVKSHGHNVDLSVNGTYDYSTSFAHKIEKTQLNVPDLSKSFDLARTDIPDLGKLPDSRPAPAPR